MRALLFHAPAYTADGYDDTRPRLVRAACKGSDNNVERRDIPENGLSVSDWYLRNILYIDARSHEILFSFDSNFFCNCFSFSKICKLGVLRAFS